MLKSKIVKLLCSVSCVVMLSLSLFGCEEISTTITTDQDLINYFNTHSLSTYDIDINVRDYIESNCGTIYEFDVMYRNGLGRCFIVDYNEYLLIIDSDEGYIVDKKNGVLEVEIKYGDKGGRNDHGITQKQRYTSVAIKDIGEPKSEQYKTLYLTAEAEPYIKDIIAQ